MSLQDLMYKPRIADELLARELEGMGAVLIKGPKWCGKTTTAEQMAESVIYIDEPENVDQNIRTSEINPSQLLEGKTPRLIDEWQIAPKLWDAVRFTVDRRKLDGQFILTSEKGKPFRYRTDCTDYYASYESVGIRRLQRRCQSA